MKRVPYCGAMLTLLPCICSSQQSPYQELRQSEESRWFTNRPMQRKNAEVLIGRAKSGRNLNDQEVFTLMIAGRFRRDIRDELLKLPQIQRQILKLENLGDAEVARVSMITDFLYGKKGPDELNNYVLKHPEDNAAAIAFLANVCVFYSVMPRAGYNDRVGPLVERFRNNTILNKNLPITEAIPLAFDWTVAYQAKDDKKLRALLSQILEKRQRLEKITVYRFIYEFARGYRINKGMQPEWPSIGPFEVQ